MLDNRIMTSPWNVAHLPQTNNLPCIASCALSIDTKIIPLALIICTYWSFKDDMHQPSRNIAMLVFDAFSLNFGLMKWLYAPWTHILSLPIDTLFTTRSGRLKTMLMVENYDNYQGQNIVGIFL